MSTKENIDEVFVYVNAKNVADRLCLQKVQRLL